VPSGPGRLVRRPGTIAPMLPINARLGEALADPLSLFRPVVVLAGLVILAAGVAQAQGLVATVAFEIGRAHV